MNNILNALGLAQRARALISGENIVLDAILNKKAKLVLVSNDISDGSLKKISDKSRTNEIELIQIDFDRYDIGKAIGKEFRVCLAVTDKNFVSMIKKKL